MSSSGKRVVYHVLLGLGGMLLFAAAGASSLSAADASNRAADRIELQPAVPIEHLFEQQSSSSAAIPSRSISVAPNTVWGTTEVDLDGDGGHLPMLLGEHFLGRAPVEKRGSPTIKVEVLASEDGGRWGKTIEISTGNHQDVLTGRELKQKIVASRKVGVWLSGSRVVRRLKCDISRLYLFVRRRERPSFALTRMGAWGLERFMDTDLIPGYREARDDFEFSAADSVDEHGETRFAVFYSTAMRVNVAVRATTDPLARGHEVGGLSMVPFRVRQIHRPAPEAGNREVLTGLRIKQEMRALKMMREYQQSALFMRLGGGWTRLVDEHLMSVPTSSRADCAIEVRLVDYFLFYREEPAEDFRVKTERGAGMRQSGSNDPSRTSAVVAWSRTELGDYHHYSAPPRGPFVAPKMDPKKPPGRPPGRSIFRRGRILHQLHSRVGRRARSTGPNEGRRPLLGCLGVFFRCGRSSEEVRAEEVEDPRFSSARTSPEEASTPEEEFDGIVSTVGARSSGDVAGVSSVDEDWFSAISHRSDMIPSSDRISDADSSDPSSRTVCPMSPSLTSTAVDLDQLVAAKTRRRPPAIETEDIEQVEV